MKNIKIFSITSLLMLSLGVSAVESPLTNLEKNLNSSLSTKETSNNLSQLTSLALERNKDVGVAFQNYIEAKKRVSIARSAFNPLTTGHALGIALGLNYLWSTIALEAVLSIPTKIYNVSSNKYLEKAEFYNSKEANAAILNELAHLYYDILTHDIILKSIDKEIEILMYQQSSLTTKDRLDLNKSMIISLKMERIDMYNLYTEEKAALKTLLALDPSTQLELAHNNKEISRDFTEGVDLEGVQNLAFVNSNEFKRSLNIKHAADQNIKSVQWSILSFSGLNFSYASRVREAKLSAQLANSVQESSEFKVKNASLIALNNLNSSVELFNNYSEISSVSMGLFNDLFNLNQLGKSSDDAAVESSIGAIRDFRSKIVAHYALWSSLSDLSKALNMQIVYNSSDDKLQNQIEKNSYYGISINDFKVVLKNYYSNGFALGIKSKKTNNISKVEYIFDDNAYQAITSTNDRNDFIASVYKQDTAPESFSGKAVVTLNNGHEFTIDFKF